MASVFLRADTPSPLPPSQSSPAAVLLGLAGVFLMGVLGALYCAGFWGNTAARLRLDHSITPPASVAHIRCDEFFSTCTFLDSTATVSFDLDRADLAGLLAQIRWNSDPLAKNPEGEIRGMSKEGNVVVMKGLDLEKPRVRVNLTTMWN